MKEIKLSDLKFDSWHEVSIGKERISTWWGKTFITYRNEKFYVENFSWLGLLLRRIFGYKKEFCRNALWQGLKDKKIVSESASPSKKKFRSATSKIFSLLTKKLEPVSDRPKLISENEIAGLSRQKLLETGTNPNKISGCWPRLSIAIYQYVARGSAKASLDAVYRLIEHGERASAEDLLILLEGFQYLTNKEALDPDASFPNYVWRKKKASVELIDLLLKNGAIVTRDCVKASLKPVCKLKPGEYEIDSQVFIHLYKMCPWPKQEIAVESYFLTQICRYGDPELLQFVLNEGIEPYKCFDEDLIFGCSCGYGLTQAEIAKIHLLLKNGVRATEDNLETFVKRFQRGGVQSQEAENIIDQMCSQGVIPTCETIKWAIIKDPVDKERSHRIFQKMFLRSRSRPLELLLKEARDKNNSEVFDYLVSKNRSYNGIN